MNFFESQDRVRKNTLHLVFLFTLAVVTLIIMTNLLVMAVFGYINSEQIQDGGALLEQMDWRTFAAVSAGAAKVGSGWAASGGWSWWALSLQQPSTTRYVNPWSYYPSANENKVADTYGESVTIKHSITLLRSAAASPRRCAGGTARSAGDNPVRPTLVHGVQQMKDPTLSDHVVSAGGWKD